MAAFKLEASTLQKTSLNLGSATPKFGAVKVQSLVQYNALLISSKPKKPLLGCRASTSEAQCGCSTLSLALAKPLVSPDALLARAAEEGFVADVSGEVVRILLEDGAPVGYGDPVMIILPSFPGVKELL